LNVSEAHLQVLLEEARAEVSRQTPRHILVIEDEPLMAMQFASCIQELGHSTDIARTFSEAMAAAKRKQPDLLVADINLGIESGINVVDALQAQFSVPVVFVTGAPDRLLTGHRPEPVPDRPPAA